MQIGWIDFSKSDRDKAVDALDRLSEQGTLDEMGIAPVRDRFSDRMFPGTSILQNRAKYFLVVPYACRDLELSCETDRKTAERKLDIIEQETSRLLIASSDSNERGIIGANGDWVKRAPSTLYWAGLRRLGIFKDENMSLSQYIREMCADNARRSDVKKFGNRNDRNADDKEQDDADAGDIRGRRYFDIPTYRRDKWKEGLTIKLTREEAEFLSERIRLAAPDALFAYLLENKSAECVQCVDFYALGGIIDDQAIKDVHTLAADFSRFYEVLVTAYNYKLSHGENSLASSRKQMFADTMPSIAGKVDTDVIFARLKIDPSRYRKLKTFLDNAKQSMADGDFDGLCERVKAREADIRGSRAKMSKPSFDPSVWVGARSLDYRFGTVKQFIADITDGKKGYGHA